MKGYVFAALALFATLTVAAQDNGESRLIASVADGKVEGVLVLSVFGGYFPIASRYTVSAAYKGNGLRLNSPVFIPEGFSFRQEGDFSMITVDRDSSCDFLESKPPDVLVEEQGSIANLAYQSATVVIDGAPASSSVQISDGDTCISIVGDESGFWKASIQAYSRLWEQGAPQGGEQPQPSQHAHNRSWAILGRQVQPSGRDRPYPFRGLTWETRPQQQSSSPSPW